MYIFLIGLLAVIFIISMIVNTTVKRESPGSNNINDYRKDKDYIKKLINQIEYINGYKKNILYAQVMLETANLKKVIGTNLFNIKASKSRKNKIAVDTTEYIQGKKTATVAYFRNYKDFEESIQDYINLISGWSRYNDTWNSRHDPQTYYYNLYVNGYATDPQYYSKLLDKYESTV